MNDENRRGNDYIDEWHDNDDESFPETSDDEDNDEDIDENDSIEPNDLEDDDDMLDDKLSSFIKRLLPKNITSVVNPQRYKAMVEIIKVLKEGIKDDFVDAEYKIEADKFLGIYYDLIITMNDDSLFLNDITLNKIDKLNKAHGDDLTAENLISGLEFSKSADGRLRLTVTFSAINTIIQSSDE